MTIVRATTAVLLSVTSAVANAAQESSATEVLGDAFLPVLWICAAVATLVFGAIVYSVAAFSHSDAAESAFDKRAKEFAWSLVPMVIVIAAAAPAIKDMGSHSARASHLEHRVIARAEHLRPSVPHELDSQAVR